MSSMERGNGAYVFDFSGAWPPAIGHNVVRFDRLYSFETSFVSNHWNIEKAFATLGRVELALIR